MIDHSDVIHPRELLELLRSHGFTLKKGLGQNFLVDENILDKIVKAAALSPEDGVFEIGPGAGVMTQRLSRLCKRVVAVEKDTALRAVLDDTLQGLQNIRLIYADVLKLDLQEVWRNFSDCKRIVVVANLPYYVTTPILFHLLDSEIPVDEIVVMVQKEVASRLTASPGTKDYGALTVSVALRADVEAVVQVHKGAFIPQPGVDSTVVRLNCRSALPADIRDLAMFRRVVKTAFATRRKTLLNALSHGLHLPKTSVLEVLQNLDIQPERRGETLSFHEFAQLSNYLLNVVS